MMSHLDEIKNQSDLAHTEIEIKLNMSRAEIERFQREADLSAMHVEQVKNIHLKAKYFDTKDLFLKARKSALRIRLEPKGWVQTFKAIKKKTESKTGLKNDIQERLEINAPLLTPELNLDLLRKDPALGNELDNIDFSNMIEVFETDIHRAVHQIEFNDSRIEVAIDMGVINSGSRSVSVHEVELELLSGTPRDLFLLSEEWSKSFEFEIGKESKAQRGYELFGNDSR